MLAATELGLDAFAMRDAWARTEPVKQRAVLAAVSQLGVPYRSMASSEGVGFDCSGLTSYAFRRAGVEIPRPSREQINAADGVDRGAAEAGDLVYYPGHVSMYLGVGEAIVHSPNSGNEVEITFSSPRRVSSLRYGDPTT
jgi:cell wall-associated NlpC family hydrolase